MITEADLKRIMREGAGQAEGIDLDGDIADVLFSDLGYDSLAVLETVSRIEREYGIRIPEDALSAVRTPGEFLALVNRATAEAA
ncbi:acyl carrier protein [Kitasatospora sp. CM 4170]|uniref:Acyl carrier protein n=1 Tax=Kitasatospora aburaviensis TaxID=67265 RepID=A0ABW1ETG8_9ACTN|nr:acyl carrier protein [Kitasatospora sp. CM 4170]WNM44398.1 acyl carrier protein [Kitasatospora sp. CM 4170]